jgi:hypothetical protein
MPGPIRKNPKPKPRSDSRLEDAKRILPSAGGFRPPMPSPTPMPRPRPTNPAPEPARMLQSRPSEGYDAAQAFSLPARSFWGALGFDQMPGQDILGGNQESTLPTGYRSDPGTEALLRSYMEKLMGGGR